MNTDPVAAGLLDLGVDKASAVDPSLAARTRNVLLGVERLRLAESYLNRRGDFHSSLRFILGRPSRSTRETIGTLTSSLETRPRSHGSLADLLFHQPSEQECKGHAATSIDARITAQSRVVHGFDVVEAVQSVAQQYDSTSLLVGVHGSFADSSYIEGLSDLDLLVIVPRGTLERPIERIKLSKVIEKLNVIASRVDPFQHHGAFCVPEELLFCYPENYLPLPILQSVLWLSGKRRSIEVQSIRSPLASAFFAQRLLKYLEWHAHRIGSLGYSDIREILQVVQLLPSILADVVGGPIKKQESIPWLLERKDPALDVLRVCTHQRFNWLEVVSGLGNLTLKQNDLRDRVLAGYGGENGLALLLFSYASLVRELLLEGIDGVIH